MNRLLLEGKTAIITGGSSGLGLAIARLYAEEGAKVVIFARSKDKIDQAVEEIRAKGGEAMGVPGDVSLTEDIKRVFSETLKAYGKVDIVVNNAGMGSGSKSIEGTDDEFFDKLIATNLRGPFMMCREAIEYFLERGEGHIINVASVQGVRPVVGAAYVAAKGGVINLTKNIAMRTVGTKIRVNCLAPGLTLTPMAMASTMSAKEIEAQGLDAGNKKDDIELKAVDFASLGPKDLFPVPGTMKGYLHARSNRFCISTAEEVAGSALFLASDLSAAIHGQVIVADRGGFL